MALILKTLYHGYFWLFDEMRDPRTDGHFLIDYPIVPFGTIFVYWLLVKEVLPKYMEFKEPYDLKLVIKLYNIIQIILNAYVAVKCLLIFKDLNFFCTEVDFSNSPQQLNIIHIGRTYYMLKYLDLIDTVFFVLRKNFHQVSFLHVWHHCGMVGTIWIGMRFIPTGHGIWLVLLNSIVHVFMFAYYFLAALNDNWKKNVALKKAITQMQLLQFGLLMISFGLASRPSCNYPISISGTLLIFDVMMFTLFMDFYRSTYIKKKQTKPKSS